MTRFAILLNCGAAAIALAAALAPAPAAAQASASPFTSATRYDALGRVTGTISADPDGAGALPFLAVRNSYDAAGRLTRVETGTLSGWQAESVAPASWTGFTALRTLETSYDAMDRKLRDTLIAGASTGTVQTVTQYSYDVMGRLDCTAVRMNPATFASLPSGACTPATASTTYGPDRISRAIYDAAGQRLQVREAVGVSGQEAAEATWAYDDDGRVTTLIDANGNRAELRYDGHGRQDRWTFPSTTGPSAYDDATQATALASAGSVNAADYEGYGYDPAGNRTALRHRAGNSTAFTYDHLNRLATRDRPGSERDVTYGYDLRGLQTSATFTGTSDAVTNAFDGFGRPVSSAIAMGGTTRTLLYRHDPDGNRTRITYPDGNWWQQDYDGLNRPTWLSYAGSYGQQYLNYNGDGTAQAANKANGTSVAFSYDGVQRMAGFSLDAAGMTSDSGWTLGRNPASQLVSLARSNDLYAYAPANATTAYAIDGLNRTTQVAGASVSYDGNGNLTGDPGAMSGGASATTFTYDSENRLVSASGAHGATLAYDPLDRLYALTSGGTITTFLYDGDALVAEYEGSTLLRRHIHWPGADVPVATWEGAGLTDPRYLHADERGSIVAITDQSGAATLNRYDEYGVPGATNAGRFQYTGQLWLPELGLYYYKARMYSPYGGRFMQTDPVGYDGGINLYEYVEDDPVDGRDPTGEFDPSAWRLAAERVVEIEAVGGGPEDVVADVVAAVVVGVIVFHELTASGDGDRARAARTDAASGRDRTASAGRQRPAAAETRTANVSRGIPESRLGPSGRPMRHFAVRNSRSAARDAAQARTARGQAADEHGNPARGDPHFHATDAAGNKRTDGVHYTYPRRGRPRRNEGED